MRAKRSRNFLVMVTMMILFASTSAVGLQDAATVYSNSMGKSTGVATQKPKTELFTSVASSNTSTALFQTNAITNTAPITATTLIPQPSDEAQQALAFIAKRESVPVDTLRVVNEFARKAPLLYREFRAFTIEERLADGRLFEVLVDVESKQVDDRATIETLENRAARTLYGKFDVALYERLQKLPDDSRVNVMIWAADLPGQDSATVEARIYKELAAQFPEAGEAIARGGNPLDVDDPELSHKIAATYYALQDAAVDQRVTPLVQVLRSTGAVITTTKSIPAIFALVSKQDITKIAGSSEISSFALSEAIYTPQLTTAIATDRAPAVLARGYNGDGATIAIVEGGNVDVTGSCGSGTTNCFSNPGTSRTGADQTPVGQRHATLVASVAASNNTTYTGMAPGAEILSAGITQGGDAGLIDGATWAFDHAADIANMSIGSCSTAGELTPGDRAIDYLARNRKRLVVVSAGNSSSSVNDFCNYDYVRAPSQGWNVFTVGGYDDNGTSSWRDDSSNSVFQWKNPVSPNSDREKPEVVAPGVDIKGVGPDGNLVELTGSSFSAPQVAGQAALMIDHKSSLATAPMATKAIIMATANHNIEGPTGIPTNGSDFRDGAGGINADLADTTASIRGNTPSTTSNACTGPCWWGETITPSSFNANNARYYYFKGNAGDHIRVAISWWSNSNCTNVETNCPVNGDVLSTNLGLRLNAPNGDGLSVSNNFDNNYELVPPDGDLILPTTGTYRIDVTKQAFNETSNEIGVAWTRLPPVTSGLAVSSRGSGKLDLFARGRDDALWYRSYNGSWSNWQSLGGTLTSDPTAVSWNGSRIDVFARGVNNDLMHKYYNGSWSTWASLGNPSNGVLTSGPAVASLGSGQLDVYARGIDNAIWHISWNGSWSSWSSVGGDSRSDPGASARSDQLLSVFYRGQDNQLWHRWWQGTAGNGMFGVPKMADIESAPAVVSFSDRQTVFVRIANNDILYLPADATHWLDWQQLSGPILSRPAVVTWNGTRIDLFARSTFGVLFHIWWDGNTWSSIELLGDIP